MKESKEKEQKKAAGPDGGAPRSRPSPSASAFSAVAAKLLFTKIPAR